MLPLHFSPLAPQGDTVCVWGECYLIADRRRQQKLADDEMERARNPAWYTRAWNTVTGGGGTTTEVVIAKPAEAVTTVSATPPVAAPVVVIAEGSGAGVSRLRAARPCTRPLACTPSIRQQCTRTRPRATAAGRPAILFDAHCAPLHTAPDFDASPRFEGARRGYVFKLGAKGLGYYKEH